VLYTHLPYAGNESFRLYDLEHGELIYAGHLPADRDTLLAGTPDGRRLLFTGPFKLSLWALPEADEKSPPPR
jgi:hypothetical protein